MWRSRVLDGAGAAWAAVKAGYRVIWLGDMCCWREGVASVTVAEEVRLGELEFRRGAGGPEGGALDVKGRSALVLPASQQVPHLFELIGHGGNMTLIVLWNVQRVSKGNNRKSTSVHLVLHCALVRPSHLKRQLSVTSKHHDVLDIEGLSFGRLDKVEDTATAHHCLAANSLGVAQELAINAGRAGPKVDLRDGDGCLHVLLGRGETHREGKLDGAAVDWKFGVGTSSD